MAFPLFESVCKALVKKAVNVVSFGFGGEIAIDVWEYWRNKTNEPDRRREIESIAQADESLIQTSITDVLSSVAAEFSDSQRKSLEAYLKQIPEIIRQILRRPGDQSGTTVPIGLAFRRADDLLPFLTTELHEPQKEFGAEPLAHVYPVQSELEMKHQPAQLEKCIEDLANGDSAAGEQLLEFASNRLRKLTRKMLRDNPGVRRWEETDDVFQNAMMRLWRALKDKPPKSLQHFFNLATLQIRRELIDLARHYFGPEGSGGKHDSENVHDDSDSAQTPRYEKEETTREPSRLAIWTELHEQVDSLRQEEREVFELLFYQGISQAEAMKMLGLSERTLQRRWQSARLSLHEKLGGELPF